VSGESRSLEQLAGAVQPYARGHRSDAECPSRLLVRPSRPVRRARATARSASESSSIARLERACRCLRVDALLEPYEVVAVDQGPSGDPVSGPQLAACRRRSAAMTFAGPHRRATRWAGRGSGDRYAPSRWRPGRPPRSGPRRGTGPRRGGRRTAGSPPHERGKRSRTRRDRARSAPRPRPVAGSTASPFTYLLTPALGPAPGSRYTAAEHRDSIGFRLCANGEVEGGGQLAAVVARSKAGRGRVRYGGAMACRIAVAIASLSKGA